MTNNKNKTQPIYRLANVPELTVIVQAEFKMNQYSKIITIFYHYDLRKKKQL